LEFNRRRAGYLARRRQSQSRINKRREICRDDRLSARRSALMFGGVTLFVLSLACYVELTYIRISLASAYVCCSSAYSVVSVTSLKCSGWYGSISVGNRRRLSVNRRLSYNDSSVICRPRNSPADISLSILSVPIYSVVASAYVVMFSILAILLSLA
jgi:hypothetical protein